jgi:hypothetical protein
MQQLLSHHHTSCEQAITFGCSSMTTFTKLRWRPSTSSIQTCNTTCTLYTLSQHLLFEPPNTQHPPPAAQTPNTQHPPQPAAASRHRTGRSRLGVALSIGGAALKGENGGVTTDVEHVEPTGQ